MSEGWTVAVLGATGAVGEAIIEQLQECRFPIAELYPLASARSAGERVRFKNRSLMVQNAAEFDWAQAQLAFFVAGSDASAQYAEEAANAGCLVIDSSGLFALEPDIPLVIADINPSVLADYRNRNIISLPHSLTSQLLIAVKPLLEITEVTRIHATSLLAASEYGKAAVEELAGQSARLLNGISVDEGIFNKQLAFNLLPLLANERGYVLEEARVIEEMRKILQDGQLPISITCIQSPVFYGHSQSVSVEFLRAISEEEAKNAWSQNMDIQLSDRESYPTPVENVANPPQVSIGCVRSDYGLPEGLQFWSVADNVRYGGARIAIKAAETVILEYMY